ncbi:MAG: iron complex outermembrane receptor protein [Halioglobus sp.]|jgi:iron complex outermembrane receptor protein
MRRILSVLARSILSSAPLSLCFIANLSAQPADPDPKPSQAKSFALEEVIVTANRHAQNLQEVAISVTAFTADFFQDTGVTDLAGLEQYTPNLKITPGADSRSTSIRIRGIGSVGSNSGIDPSVGMFIDGVYQGRAGMSIGDLIDIERVEILRGPQGTLYGKNTAAGAISIITLKPAPEFEAQAEITYANDNRKEFRGMVNLPLGDSDDAVRLTGFSVNSDHLYDNTFTGEGLNDANKWGVKSRFLFDTDSAGEWLITLDYSKEDTDCCGFAAIDYEGFSTLNSPITNNPSAAFSEQLGLNAQGTPILQYTAFEDSEGFSPPPADPFSDDYWFDGEISNKVTVGGVALEWNYDLDNDATLTLINAWRNYTSDSTYDGDFTGYNAVRGSTDVELDQYSSELRYHVNSGDTFETQLGLYAYYSEFNSIGTFNMQEPLVRNIGIAFFYPEGSLNTDDNLYTTTSMAAFGQFTWNITDKFSATLGLRYTYEKKEREGSQITEGLNPGFPAIDIPPVAGPDVFYDDKRSDTDVSPSLNLRYFINPDLMTYASVSRGFKSGGFNQRREVVGSNGEFDEEIATNYELGWKGNWLDRRLQINGTFYFINYDDFQSQGFDGSSIKVTNAGVLQSYGTEIEITYLPTENLLLGSSIGYTKAEYDKFENGQCTVEEAFEEFYIVNGAQGGSPGTFASCRRDLAGKPLDNAPEWNLSSYAQYDMVITDSLVGIARLEHSYIDSYFLDSDLDPNLENDAVNLVNLRLTLTTPENDWEVAIWGRNLLGEEYYALGLDIPTLGGYTGIVAPDTTYGITARLYF